MGSLRNGTIRARILVWGPPGAGKTTTLTYVNGKLKSNQKDPVKKVTLKSPPANYELLPVKLGDVKGVTTDLDFQTCPGPWEHAAVRKRLLQGVDGIVFVANSIGSAMKDNQKSLAELDEGLRSVGRSLVTVPVVFQWMNQKAIGSIPTDEMQAKLNKIGAQVFSVSDDQSGILKSFAAISKMAVKVVRDDYDAGKLTEASALDIDIDELPAPSRDSEANVNPFGDLAGDLDSDLGEDFGRSKPKEERTPPPEIPIGGAEDELDALLTAARPKVGGRVNGAKFKLVGAGEPTLSPDGTLSLPLRIHDDAGDFSITIQVKVSRDS